MIWRIVRENADGKETVVEEHACKAVAQKRLAYFQSLDDCYYYIESR